MRRITSCTKDRKVPKTYGLIVRAADTGRWLVVARKHTLYYSNVLRGRCKISEIPISMRNMTKNEILSLRSLADCPDTRQEYTSLMKSVYGPKIKGISYGYNYIVIALPIIRKMLEMLDDTHIYPSLPYLWPKGYQNDPNEEPLSCALREFSEESGIEQFPEGSCIIEQSIEYKTRGLNMEFATECWIASVPYEIPVPKVLDTETEVSDRRWIDPHLLNSLVEVQYTDVLNTVMSFIGCSS